jgi:hypothetical protein
VDVSLLLDKYGSSGFLSFARVCTWISLPGLSRRETVFPDRELVLLKKKIVLAVINGALDHLSDFSVTL